MAVAPGPFLAAALLLLSSGHHCLAPPPPCPDVCTCQRDPALLNCSSAGLYLVPQHIPDSVSELHLSHNHLSSVALDRPLHKLQTLWLDNNGITHLSLCVERTRGGWRERRMRPWGRRGCDSWAPTLQLLSVENNHLQQLPEGLEGSTSLQVLHISFNRISTLRAGQFRHLRQLKELHLQHNLIASLHPHIFQDLPQLQVLDLSFNVLTSLHPLMHLSLRNIGAEVKLAGNKWHCDCSLRSLRRRMVYDRNRGPKAWNVTCASPSTLLGRDLLQLEEDELSCLSTENDAELHQDITVYRGSQILLSCSAQDSTWLTPNGRTPVGDRQAGLLITDIREGDTGLYVCASEENNVLSVFNLQISRDKGTKRKARSLPRIDTQITQDVSDRIVQERNQAGSQSNLALAVCLSVFITFLVAFIIGVIARPWLDPLWQRITNKNSAPATTEVSIVEQSQYENQAFNCCDEPGQVCTHRERRVTFSRLDIGENSNVDRYDSVANDSQENINKYKVYQTNRDAHKAADSGSETSSQSSREENQRNVRADAGLSENTKLEYIQETNGPKTRRYSSSSDSSVFVNALTTDRIKSSQVSEEFIQQRAPVSKGKNEPNSSMDYMEKRGFSSDGTPRETHPEMWQQNEQHFKFSDSDQSASSSGHVFGSLKTLKRTDQKKRNDDLSSNSSSYLSENEITEYTVNLGPEEDMEWNDNAPEVTKDVLRKVVSVPIHGKESAVISPGLQGDYRYDTKSHAMRPKASFSSHSSESEDDTAIKQKQSARYENYSSDRVTGKRDPQQKVVPLPRTKLPGSFVIPTKDTSPDTKKPTSPAVYSSSSSSESELHGSQRPIQKYQSSSSSDSEDDTSHITKQDQLQTSTTRYPPIKVSPPVHPDHQWPAINLECTRKVKRRLDVRVTAHDSDSSSSSDSEDEPRHIKKQEQWQTSTPRIPKNRSPTGSPDQLWPAINLERTTKVKRRLDIKRTSFNLDTSSSSDSEDDRGHGDTQRPGKAGVTQFPVQESHSSFSSDSEDEPSRIIKQEQWQTSTTRLPNNTSPTGSVDNQWPAINLGQTTKVKRRLDIKVKPHQLESSSSSDSEDDRGRPWKVDVHQPPVQESHSSSSSDSDDETSHITKQDQWQTSTTRYPPIKVSPPVHPDHQWLAINLERTGKVKRRLDVRVTAHGSDSSSSSDSEDEPRHTTQQGQWQTPTTRNPSIKVSQTGRPDHQWPVVDLDHTRVKRRLDIKVKPHQLESSSSSDSEDEPSHIIKQEQWQTSTRFPNTKSPSGSPDNQWPALNLDRRTKIKRRLDIKAPSSKSDTSSSRDSEDDRGHEDTQRPGKAGVTQFPEQESHSSFSSGSEDEPSRIIKQEQWQTSTTRLPNNTSPTGSVDNQWPAINLGQTTKVKRRLDIKVKPHQPESSSSSDSEDEPIRIIKQEQWQTSTTRLPNNTSPTGRPDQQWPAISFQTTTKVKRRLDIKVKPHQLESSSSSDSEDDRGRPWKVDVHQPPVQESHSSSSSDSDDETRHTIQQGQWQTPTTRHPSIKVSQTGRPDHQWPVVDLGHTRVKRCLDIKVKPHQLESSSSSNSEDGANIIKKQEQWQTSTRFPNTKSPSGSPDNQWPALNLDRRTKIKRRLDIKAPSSKSDTSSSSDSEDDRGHGDTQRPGKAGVTQFPEQESHSSFSSGSEDEPSRIIKQEQWQTSTTRLPNNTSPTGSVDNQWPAINLGQTTKVKRRLDIKVKPHQPESSSSSDSEDEPSRIIKQEQWQTSTTKLPNNTSPTGRPDQQWPAMSFQTTTKVKRRLDIKVKPHQLESSSSSDSEDDRGRPWKVDVHQPPVQESHSSSSSDSDDETRHTTQQGQWQTPTTRHPSIKVSQTGRPDHQWPVVDLGHTRVKRRLDIKVKPHQLESSSSSDSEDGANIIKKQEQWQTSTRFPNSKSPSGSPDNQWPALNLDRRTKIKRRLDIKAPSSKSDTSSSSDSEDDRGHGDTQRPGKAGVTQFPEQESHSSFSSDSGDEPSRIIKQEQWQTSTTRLPNNTSPTGSVDNQWPAINLGQTTKVKRRLDIKVKPHQPESSSSSDSEDEPSRIIKQEQWQTSTTRLPNNTSPTGRPDQQWPAMSFQTTTKVKRRLDIKVKPHQLESSSSSDSEDDRGRPWKVDVHQPPVQESHSSSSSDSDDETRHTTQQGQWQTPTTRHPSIKVSQTGRPDHQWPVVDLGHTRVKRRLDIKVKPHQLESSSSSDSEDGANIIKKQEQWQTSTRFPNTKSPSGSPDNQWPALNLDRRTKIKRRLDIKATTAKSNTSSTNDSEDDRGRPWKVDVHQPPVQESHSSSSSDSDDEPSHITKQDQWQTSTTRYPPIKVSPPVHPNHQWPAINLERTGKVKRRLDVRVTANGSDSSSSSDSEDEPRHTTQQGQWQTPTTRNPSIKVSQTGRPDHQWPVVDLDHTRVKRRLDVKIKPHQPESSSSSDSEDEPSRIIKQEQWQTSTTRLPNNTSPTGRPDQQWPAMSFQTTTKVKRRLDIKAPSYESDSSSSSDSENDKGGHTKPGLGVAVISSNTKDFIKSSKIPLMQPFNKPKADDNIKLEKYIINNDSTDKTSSNSNKTPEISTELESRWAKMNLNKSRFRKHLEITSRKQEAPSPPLSPSPVSPSYTSYDRGTRSKLSTRGARGIIHTESKSDSGISVGRPRKGSSPSSDSSSSDEEDASRKDISERWKGPARSSSQTYPSPVESSVFMTFDQPHSQTQEVKGQELDILADTDSLITYKRSIFKSTSLLSNATLPTVNNKDTKSTVGNDEVEGPSHSHGSREAPLSPKTFPSKNFDEVIKTRIAQSRTTTDVEVPPEIRWNGIGRQPMPISNPRSADGGELTQRWEPTKMEVSLLDDSNIPIGTNVLIPTEWRGSAISDPVSSRYQETVENSPSSPNKILRMQSDNGRERRGLNALKAMSSERKKWDMHSESVMDASPQFNGYESPISTRFYTGSSEGQKPQTQLPPYSNAEHVERVQHLVYGVPLYRRHAFGTTTPPPIPATPPPDEIEIPAWRSPQSIERLPGIRTHPYQSGPSTTKSEDVAEHFDNPYNNISSV